MRPKAAFFQMEEIPFWAMHYIVRTMCPRLRAGCRKSAGQGFHGTPTTNTKESCGSLGREFSRLLESGKSAQKFWKFKKIAQNGEKVAKMLDMFRDDDDVQYVWRNWDGEIIPLMKIGFLPPACQRENIQRIERGDPLTLRSCIKRICRKTICFSKNQEIHMVNRDLRT